MTVHGPCRYCGGAWYACEDGPTCCDDCLGAGHPLIEDDPDTDWRITVTVPRRIGSDDYERLMNAVADAAWEAQPASRDWDVFVYGCGPRPE